MPAVPAFDPEDMDTMSRWLYHAHGGDLHAVTADHVRHAYYGMCSYIDDKVGRILETVEQLGIRDETVIVFTSDHGEMLGERGMWFKQSFHEWSVRVPLIVSIPGSRPSRIDNPVSLVDLLPTLMEIATDGKGGTPVSPVDGHSLLHLLDGNAGWENRVISEYTGEGVVAPCRMVRRDNFKLIYTHGHPDLLYNLDSDPLELVNLAEEPEHQHVRNRLKSEILDGWNPERIGTRCIQSQKERLFIQEVTQGDPDYAYLYRSGDRNRYIRNASAVGTKARARYPLVEPTPFLR